MGMMNTYEIVILNNVAAFIPLTTFLYAGFIRSTIPKELEEAAHRWGKYAGDLLPDRLPVVKTRYCVCLDHRLCVYLERLPVCDFLLVG
jgi:hypothetical protein